MKRKRTDRVHKKKARLFQPGADQQRGRSRRRGGCTGEGLQRAMESDEQDMGPKLAEQQLPQLSVSLLLHHRRWTSSHFHGRCPYPLVRPDFLRRPVLVLSSSGILLIIIRRAHNGQVPSVLRRSESPL